MQSNSHQELVFYADRAASHCSDLASCLPADLVAWGEKYARALEASRRTPGLMRELPPFQRVVGDPLSNQASRRILNWVILRGVANLSVPSIFGRYVSKSQAQRDYLEYLELMYEHFENADYNPDSEEFIKDVRFAYGYSLPADAWWVELRSRLANRLGLWYLLRHPMCLVHGVPARLPCVRLYVEPRRLDLFNENSLVKAFRYGAEALNADSSLVGLTVKSWFNDPHVGAISPRLAYLNSIAVEGGAILIRGASSAKDVERATMKSGTRRELYRRGEYIPTSYTLFWPRKELLSWASSKFEPNG